MSNSDYASKQLNKIRFQIAEAADLANRKAEEITLVGAAKQQTPELLQAFVDQGLNDIGENYLQEAQAKQQTMTGVEGDAKAINWHFIGHIQSNKTKTISQCFTWVHGVDRLKVARRLASETQPGSTLNVLVQVDMDDEQSKGGVSHLDAAELCDAVAQFESLALRGLMLIPRARKQVDAQRRVFGRARDLLQHSNQRYGLAMDTLSMGMSGDFAAAIMEGSTMVRLGTALFGARRA